MMQWTLEPSFWLSLINTGILSIGIRAAMKWQEVLTRQDEMAKDIRSLRDHVERQNGRVSRTEAEIARMVARHETEDRLGGSR